MQSKLSSAPSAVGQKEVRSGSTLRRRTLREQEAAAVDAARIVVASADESRVFISLLNPLPELKCGRVRQLN